MSATVMCLMALGMSLAALTVLLMKVPAFAAALKSAWATVSGLAIGLVAKVKGLFGSKA